MKAKKQCDSTSSACVIIKVYLETSSAGVFDAAC